MGKKVYAIKKGFDVRENMEVSNKVVNTWDECLYYVKGVKGALYKSFLSIDEAKEYLKDGRKLLRKGIDAYPENIPHAYVDGSYNDISGKYSYGLVVVYNELIIHSESGVSADDSKKELRQIAGELKGAIRAVEFAVEKGYREICVFHDYEGIYHHAQGTWERRDKSSQEYYANINKLIDDNKLEIIFVKVDSHTNDFYNEMVDELAKRAAGVTLKGVVEKLLKKQKIRVDNVLIKDQIRKLVKEDLADNILVIKNEKLHII